MSLECNETNFHYLKNIVDFGLYFRGSIENNVMGEVWEPKRVPTIGLGYWYEHYGLNEFWKGVSIEHLH